MFTLITQQSKIYFTFSDSFPQLFHWCQGNNNVTALVYYHPWVNIIAPPLRKDTQGHCSPPVTLFNPPSLSLCATFSLQNNPDIFRPLKDVNLLHHPHHFNLFRALSLIFEVCSPFPQKRYCVSEETRVSWQSTREWSAFGWEEGDFN